MRLGVLLAVLAACGRIGFGIAPDPTGDGDNGDGAPVAPGVTITVSMTGSCTRIAWSGSHIGIVWREGTNFGTSTLWFAEADMTGAFSRQPAQVLGPIDNAECPAIIWNGTEYLVAIATGALNRRDIDTFRVTPNGIVSTRTNVVSDSGDSTDPVLAINGNVVLLAWADQTGTNYDNKARALNVDGAGAQVEVKLSGIEANNGSPHVAAIPTGFLVTWRGTTLRLTRFDAAGTLVMPETTMGFSSGGGLATQWTGTDLFGAWAANDLIGIMRFNEAGTLTSAQKMINENRAVQPALAWTGSEAAVLYLESYSLVQYHLARFTPAGDYLGEMPVANATSSFAPASLLFANGKYIASFEANVGAIVRVF